MLYLSQALFAWLLVAAGLGVVVGLLRWKAMAVGEKSGSRSRAGFLLFGLPLAAGATAAWLRWLPGRQGLWLETALLLLVAYLFGCGLGWLSRGWFNGQRAVAKAASPTRARAGTPAASEPAGETAAERENEPAEMTGEAEALTAPAAALPAMAPAAPDVFGAAREFLVAAEAQAQIQARTGPDAPLLSPPASPHECAEAEDDLRLIQGVDEDAAWRLRDLGVRRFEQIAAWTPPELQWIGEELRPIGPRTLRFWIAQARLLVGGVEPEFVRARRHREARRETSGAPLDEAAAVKFLAALPQPVAPHAKDEIYAGLRPLALLLPPYGEKDDLCQIRGLDPATAQRLNALGVWTHRQIARWSDHNALWIGSYLATPGRVEVENWIAQARELARAGDASP